MKRIKRYLQERRKRKLAEKIFCSLFSNPTVYEGYKNTTMPFRFEEKIIRYSVNLAQTYLDKVEQINEPVDAFRYEMEERKFNKSQ